MILFHGLNHTYQNRCYRVKIDNGVSEKFVILSGIPRGNKLGPLFFLLFINDLTTYLPPNTWLMYADDVKLFLPIETHDDCY